MVKVNIHDAKTRLSELLREVESNGEWIRICRNGEPIADLRPITEIGDPFKQDSILKKVKFRESPVSPVDEEDWPKEFR